MSNSRVGGARPRQFRVFCTNRYWENRDEYDGYRQTQPYTFDDYVRENLTVLKAEFRPILAARMLSLKTNG